MTIKKMIAYRKVWMGLAMLWIMLYHSEISFPFSALNCIKMWGYGGVDIFLFAAGIGNYYSYHRDESPLDFLKRRIYRLAPTYIPFIILWCIMEVLRGRLNPLFIPGNVFGVQGFSSSGISFNWYLTGISICYFLTPYFAAFVKKSRLKNNLILVAVLVILSTAFWDDTRLLVSFTRLPIYVIGMICAKYDDKPILRNHALAGALLCCFGFALLALVHEYYSEYLRSRGLYWYPFIAITPFLCYVISLVSENFKNNKVLRVMLAAVEKIGTYSFELYLVHIPIFHFTNIVIQKYEFLDNNLFWLIPFATAFLSAYLLKRVSNGIKNKLISENRLSTIR